MVLKVEHLNGLTDFFSGRYFNVRIHNSYSNDNPVLIGVLQNVILSPLLCSLIVASMPSAGHVQILMYVDDLSMFPLADNIEITTSRLQCEIKKIGQVVERLRISIKY